ncbi:MAG: ABC transporter permease [Burkholderiales bacterium]
MTKHRRLLFLDDVARDVRYAVRTLLRAPGFTLAAVATLALGIGAVTIIYSVVHNVVVDPLPYRDADRLVNVFVEDTQSGRVRGTFSFQELVDLRDQSHVFEDVIGTLGQGMRYQTPDAVELLRAVWVTPNFFEFMALSPLLGRAIDARDGQPGAPAVAVLRYRAWMTYFGGNPGVIGTTVLLNDQPRTIVGVMPQRFTWHGADLWLPSSVDPGAVPAGPPVRNFQARLKRDVSLAQAETQLNAIVERRAREYPKDYPERRRVRVVNVIAYTVGPFSGILYTTLAAVGLLLLIACCNVANMLLARGTTREREVMVRMALGAGRVRIVRQLMVESVLLAAGGAALGCLLASAGIDALVARLPQSPLPGEVDIRLNGPVLAFSLLASCLSAVAFGLMPALYTARRNLVEGGLRNAGRVAGGRGRLRSVLVVAEIALALVLVLGAGLLMRSFISVMRVDLGFAPERVLMVPLTFPPGRYTTAIEKQRFFRECLERLGALQGVQAVAATTALPPFDAGVDVTVDLIGTPNTGRPNAGVQLVTSDYFQTLGVSIVRGRAFPDSKPGEPPRYAIVNQAFVRLFPALRDPVGRQLALAPLTGEADASRHGVFEILGVVGDVRNQGLHEPVQPHVYLPWSGIGPGYPLLLVASRTDPASAIGPIRRELTLIDRSVAAVQPRTLSDTLERSYYAQPRFSLIVLGLFAASGTALVAIGVFSVMAYTVSRRRKEIAVRIALGASGAHIYRSVLRVGAQLLAAGIAVGLLSSVATNRLLTTQLWNVSPHDPVTLIGAVMLVSLVAFIACYIPARRAIRVQPSAALRED